MDLGYQDYYLEQIKKHQKSILIWYRQSGKSKVIVEYLIDIVSKNTQKQLLVIAPKQDLADSIHKRLWKELNLRINTLGNLPLSYHKEAHSSNINGNVLYFKTGKNCNDLIHHSDIIIIEELEYVRDLHMFVNYSKKDVKIILTTSQFQTEAITFFDRLGDFYLSIVSYSSIANNNEINERIKQLGGDRNAYQIQHEYGNIEELYSDLGIKKSRSLIDVWGLKIQRKRKLEEIDKKIRESNDD